MTSALDVRSVVVWRWHFISLAIFFMIPDFLKSTCTDSSFTLL